MVNKETLNKVVSIVTSKFFLIGIILLAFFLLFNQCEKTKNAKYEASIEHNNYLASKDSVRLIKKDRDNAIYEKSTYVKKTKELTLEQKELIKRLALKDNGGKTTPSTVIGIVSDLNTTAKNIQSTISKDANGDETINFVYNPKLSGKNRLFISGKTKYDLSIKIDPIDPSKYTGSVVPGTTDLKIEQNIDIVTGIYQDPKTKRLMTRVSTTFPDMKFNEINSFDITDTPEAKKTLREARKNFALGIQMGYGITTSGTTVVTQPYIGVGLTYSPKFLQFGK
jgi:hypothetical protein